MRGGKNGKFTFVTYILCLYLSFIHSFITWMKIDHLSISFINRMDENCSLLDGICLYHFGLNYCSMSFITWMERLHLDEHLLVYIICHMDENVSLWMNNLLVSLVTWMKTLGLKYHSSYG